MLKKIFITFLIVPIVGSAIYGYFYFKQVKTPMTPVLKAIPDNAVCITEACDFTSTWKNFSVENAIWKELLSVHAFKELNTKINFFDSVFVHGRAALNINEDTKIYLSVHADTAHGVDFLLAFNIPLTAEKRAINEIIEQTIPVMYTRSDTMVAGISVHQYHLRNGKHFYYYHSNTVFALSYSPDLIEKSAVSLTSGQSIIQNKSFTRVLKTASNQSHASVFVNFKNLGGIMPQYLSEDNKNFIEALSGFAQWISMDLNLKNEIITFNGFSYSSDSLHDYLSVFKNQKAPKIELTSVLPLNTAFFSYTGLSDVKAYLTQLQKYKHQEQTIELKKLESKYGIDLHQFFNTWLGSEFSSVLTESYGQNYSPDQYAVFKANDIHKAISAFSELNQSIRINNDSSSINQNEENTYRSYTISKLDLPDFLPLIFGISYPKFKTHYYTAMGNYIIMSGSEAALRGLINFYVANRTLGKDRNYLRFAETLSQNSNFFIYSAVARSSALYSNQVEKKLAETVEKNSSLFRKFQALAIQFKSSGDLFYNNLCLKYNPIYKPEFNTLWDLEADTTFITQPFLVKNLADSSDLFVLQDASLNLHLINNQGGIIWSVPLSEKIVGKIHQLHANKAGKFRLAFVTQKYFYMINESGNFPENFPVTLKANATTGLGYINFDEQQNPLLLVACDNLSIYNYKLNGQIDTDWRTERLKDTLKGNFVPFTCDGRDMICFADEARNLRLIDKRGNWIVKFKDKLPAFYNSSLFVDIKKSVNTSGVILSDENGWVYRYSFKGAVDKLELLPKLSKNYQFVWADINNDQKPEYIFTDNNRLNVINKEKEIVFDFTFNSKINVPAQIISLNDSVKKLAVSTREEGLFIFNANGTLNRNTSLAGKAPIGITSIDQQKYYFAVTTYGRRILAHAIDNEIPERMPPLP